MENMDILAKLEEYSKAGYVPMHMPGGKRNSEFASTSALDITEIDGFDNMHNAEGIIKNASERAADLQSVPFGHSGIHPFIKLISIMLSH